MDDMCNPFRPLGSAEAASAAPLPDADAWQPQMPAPEEPPEAAAIRHRQHGAGAARWVYRDATGRPLFAVVRFNLPDGGKVVLPLVWGTLRDACGWHWKAPPAPRPLYGLERLAARPAAPVLLVEGEKAADAAADLFPGHVAMCWQGGSKAVGKADWLALSGRAVIIWPDHDKPGADAAADVARALRQADAASVRVVKVPDGWPEGWDVADPPPDGASAGTLRDLLAAAEAPAEDVEPAMPPGFRLTREGLFYRPPDDPEAVPLHVCGPLRVVAATNDGSGRDWGVLLEWQDADGLRHEWAMPRAMLAGDGIEVRARLLAEGLFLAPGRRARERLAEYLARCAPPGRVRVVPRLGWHTTPAGRVFVLPDAALGQASVGRVMLQTERPDALPPLVRAGTLADWQREVAALCQGNSRLVMALCAAFAAPLLGLLGMEGGGFHLRGASSTGKTTALAVAGSVWGGGGLNGWCRRWRATDNALEAMAAAHCDLLLCLDEMGEATPEAVAAAAYMLANGGGKGRAAHDGGARRMAEWRLLFLSTGEVGLADRLAEARGGPRRAMAGQAVRVVDVPADAGAGFGLFESLHGEPDGAAFANRISAAARRFYGTAGRAFLESLAAEPEALAAAAGEARRRFLAEHVPQGAAGQVQRVADRFALLAAAGEMASALGALPFPPGEAKRAAARCFADWRGAREGGDGAAEDAAALAAVRRFLVAHGSSRFETVGDDDCASDERIINRAGWRKRGADGWHYLIPGEAWRGEVVAGLDPEAAARALRRAGHLVPQSVSAPRHTRMERVGPAVVRVYVIRDTILAGEPEGEP